MKKILLSSFLLLAFLHSALVPLSKKSTSDSRDNEFYRGDYLIVLPNSDLNGGALSYFVDLKKTQGYDVHIVSFREGDNEIEGIDGTTKDDLKEWLIDFYAINPTLEYVLLVGDVNQNNDDYNIPTFEIPSYNEAENDQTDYPYTFFDIGDGENILSPHFFLGRWSIGSATDLANIINRNLHYAQLNQQYIPDPTYLDNALVVAGNYSGEENPPEIWPVTPVWTSKWLQEELYEYGYDQVDSAFFHKHNFEYGTSPDMIQSAWNDGVGIINYRGWGDARGWHKPQFRLDEINDLLDPSFSLPVVFSFVCNTGDFGNEQQVFCFGETLLTAGTINAPKGAVAMVGPSDLDTDTRFNNVLCGALWDDMLEGREDELAPALHIGKQAVAHEFDGLEVNGTNIAEFYHHVYGVIGDPSLSVWLQEPSRMDLDIQNNHAISNSFINVVVQDQNTGEALQDVVGALIYNGELVGKDVSNENGQIDIDFEVEDIPVGGNLLLYINKGQYYQEVFNITFGSDNLDQFIENDYNVEDEQEDYGYQFEIYSISDSDWIEISETGCNLNLTDDSNRTIPYIDDDPGTNECYEQIENIDFQFYGQNFNNGLTVCSNGWASFEDCLDGNGEGCDPLSYFFNNSIAFPIGPYGLLAPFYDDLDDNNGTEPLHVYYQNFSAEGKHVIQWNNIANGQNDEYCVDNTVGDVNEDYVVDILDIQLILNIIVNGQQLAAQQMYAADCNDDNNIDVFDIILALALSFDLVEDPEECVKETFQIVLIENPSGDGEIIFQYKEVTNVDDHGVTIGIESPDKNQGIEIQFNDSPGEGVTSIFDSNNQIINKAVRFYRP